MTIEQSQSAAQTQAPFPGNPPQNVVASLTNIPLQERALVQSPYEQNLKETHWKFANETHKYVREFINNADNKAQYYIAFASTFLVWMNSKETLKFWTVPAKEWRLFEVMNIISILGMAICILFALGALLPRLKGSKKGIVFFDSIAEHEMANDYLADVLKKNEQEIVIEELRHVYELSRICSQKFFSLKISVWFAAVGLISGIFLLLFR